MFFLEMICLAVAACPQNLSKAGVHGAREGTMGNLLGGGGKKPQRAAPVVILEKDQAILVGFLSPFFDIDCCTVRTRDIFVRVHACRWHVSDPLTYQHTRLLLSQKLKTQRDKLKKLQKKVHRLSNHHALGAMYRVSCSCLLSGRVCSVSSTACRLNIRSCAFPCWPHRTCHVHQASLA